MPDLSVFDTASIIEAAQELDALYDREGIEHLWGTNITAVAVVLTNPADAVDLAFNDVYASFPSVTGTATWDAMQDTQIVDIALVDQVTVEVRFYVDAPLTNDTLELLVYDGAGWQSLELFDSGNQPPAAVATVSYDVTAFLNTLTKLNAAQVQIAATKDAAPDFTAYIDEARVVILKKQEVDAFDSALVAEAVLLYVETSTSVFDTVAVAEYVELAYEDYDIDVFDAVAVAEWVSLAADILYVSEFDTVAVSEWIDVYLDVLHVFGFDDHYVLVTESASVIDLVVEVGVVAEYIYLAEWVAAYLPGLFADVYDSVTVVEDIVPSVPDITLSVETQEDLAVTELADAQLDTIYLSVEESLTVVEDVELLDIVVELFTVFDEATLVEDIDAVTYDDQREVLWGTTVVSSWPVTDKQNAEDMAYNDQVAVVHTDLSNGNVRWSAIQDTEELNDDFIVSASVTVRFRFDAAITSGYVELILNNGDGETVLETFDSGNYFTTLTTMGYDVTAQLDTRKRVNNAVVMFRGYALDSLDIELDEVQILLAKRRPLAFDDVSVVENVSVYLDELFADAADDLLVTEVAAINDLIIEVGVVPDFVSILEVFAAQVDHLYMEAAEDVTVLDVIVPDLELTIDVNDTATVIEDATVVADLVTSVSDDITITEDVQRGPKRVDVSEELTVAEDIEVIVAKGVDVGELIVVDETVAADVVLIFDVSDTVTIVEDVTIDYPLDLAVSDDVTAEEDLQVSVIDYFPDVSVYDAVGVVDIALLNDLVIELGPAVDTVTTLEDATLSIDELFLSVFDEITVTEYAVFHDIIVELFAFDIVGVTEYATIHDIVVELAIFDAVAVVEALAVYIPDLNVSVFESLTVTESATTFDPVIELFVSESVVASDVVITEGGFNVGDDVGVGGAIIDWVEIEEYLAVLILRLDIDVFDSVALTEYVQMLDIIVELPLLYEQVGVTEASTVDLLIEYIIGDDITVTESLAVYYGIEALFVEDVSVTEAPVIVPEYLDLYGIFFRATPRKRMFTVDKRQSGDIYEVEI